MQTQITDHSDGTKSMIKRTPRLKDLRMGGLLCMRGLLVMSFWLLHYL